ncbi:CaiB/BaiF CoA transferase family protein [Bradyrhizobium erythrophlei]|uniref:CaiB/BaiF CoA transferase family protein n=1 Tax=Bradyrhizobium erythrophlei TaxID=1437360 RepID=UPI0035E6FC19
MRKSFGALSDIRILDLTQMLAGPYATMVLADQGAEVIKIEPPAGDVTRGGRHVGDSEPLSTYFQSINRNKRSVCLDLKSEQGREIFKTLCKEADAVIENFRAGVMDRLGLSYEVLSEVNPRLVYGSLRGFGDRRTGPSPYVNWPAFDVVAQAMGGMMAITGAEPGGMPTKVGPGVGDTIPGLMLAFGVLAAIHNARRTGLGQFVDVSMVDAILSICERAVWQHTAEGLIPGPEGNHHPFLCPFGIFPAADGHVALAAHDQSFFDVLCRELDLQALARDARFSSKGKRADNRRLLIPLIGQNTQKFTKAELTAKLGGRMPFGPVMNVLDIVSDPHFKARDMIVEVEHPGGELARIAGVPVKMTLTPGAVLTRSPFLGEHTGEVLRSMGMSAAEIRSALDRKVAHIENEVSPEQIPAGLAT